MASDLKAILTKLYQELVDIYNTGDFKGVSEAYTEDCQYVAPEKPIEIGREVFVTTCKKFHASGYKLSSYEVQHVHESPDGELAYLLARVDVTKADGSSLGTGSNMIMWKKVDGVYKVCVDMYN